MTAALEALKAARLLTVDSDGLVWTNSESTDTIRAAVWRQMESSSSLEEQIALLESICLFFASAFPRTPKLTWNWSAAHALSSHLIAFTALIWDQWRAKAPQLISENFALCVLGVLSYANVADVEATSNWALKVLESIKEEYRNAFTPLVDVFYHFNELDAVYTFKESPKRVKECSKLTYDCLEQNISLFDLEDQVLLRLFVARAFNLERNADLTMNVINLCCKMIGIDSIEEALKIDEPHTGLLAELCARYGAVCRFSTSQLGKAREWYKRSYDLKMKCFGPNSPTTMRQAALLGEIGTTIGLDSDGSDTQLTQAEELLKVALEFYSSEFSPAHDMALYCLENLSDGCMQRRMFQSGVILSEKMCRIAEKEFGSGHPRLCRLKSHLANAYRFAGESEKAYAASKDLEAVCRTMLGVEDSKTIEAISMAARSAWDCDKMDEALEKAREMFELAEKHLGPKHNLTALAASLLTNCLMVNRQVDEVKALLKRRMEMCEKTDVEYFTSMQALGTLLEQTGDLDAAATTFKELIGLLGQNTTLSYRDKQLSLSAAYRGLGAVCLNGDASRDAELLISKAIELSESIFTADHIAVFSMYDGLARAIASQGRFREAIQLCEDTMKRMERIRAKGDSSYSALSELKQRIQIVQHEMANAATAPQEAAESPKNDVKSSSSRSSRKKQRSAKHEEQADSDEVFSISTPVLLSAVAVSLAFTGLAAFMFIRSLRSGN